MDSQTANERLHHADWIRVLAFFLLIFFHAALPFTIFPWEVKNKEQSALLSSVIWWLHQWRLPLLFFVSGMGIHFSLKRRTLGAFLGERIIRLFVPLIFAMFFTIPMQVYVEFLQKGRFSGSYLDFYPGVWDLVPYPDGSLTWSHMWFVVYLLFLILVFLPLWAVFKTRKGLLLKTRLSSFLGKPLVSSLLGLPLVLVFLRLYLSYPETGGLVGDWFVLSFSAVLLLYGFLLGGNKDFWMACMRHRKLYGALALGTTIALFALYWWPLRLPEKYNALYVLYALLNATAIWQTILFISGLARTHLSKGSGLLNYLNQAVFPFFVIHQTVIVVIGYGVVNTSLGIVLKLVLLTTLSAATIFLIYHFIIRKWGLTRFLFGMKPVRLAKQSAIASE